MWVISNFSDVPGTLSTFALIPFKFMFLCGYAIKATIDKAARTVPRRSHVNARSYGHIFPTSFPIVPDSVVRRLTEK